MATSSFDNVASISKQTVPGNSVGWTKLLLATQIETEVFSFTVPIGKKFLLDRASFIGLADATARVKVNGTTIAFMEIAWTTRSDARYFPFGHEVLETQELTVTVFNCGEFAADYNGSIQGRTIDS